MNEENTSLIKKKKKIKLFSDAFPPDKLGNKNKFSPHSQVHRKLSDIKIEEDKIYYRELIHSDKDEVVLLHKEWFPIDYDDDYFEKILNPEKRDKEYFSLGAFYKSEGREFILGAIICELRTQLEFTYQIPEISLKLIEIPFFDDLSPFGGPYEFAYIMTIGVVDECRRMKLGSILLNKMTTLFLQRKDCLCLYLHVVKYNNTAIRFYQNNNFKNVTTLKNYYKIRNDTYDCEVYVRFFTTAEKAKEDQTKILNRLINSLLVYPFRIFVFLISLGFLFRCLRRKHKLE